MTAIRSDGTPVLRFRHDSDPRHGSIEVVIHPSVEITADLMVIAALAASLLDAYFTEPAGGGG